MEHDHDPPDVRERFGYPETAARLDELLEDYALGIEEGGRVLSGACHGGEGWCRVQLPWVLSPLEARLDLAEQIAEFEAPLGRQLVLLVQAGASSLGVWEGAELVAHKVIKKYVVRGKGKAQPLHLKTRGKSRYGSRLRLRNAARQLEQTVEKIAEWRAHLGPFRRVFRSVPVRTWGGLSTALEPHVGDAEAVVRIPEDVRVPDHEELLRIRRFLECGIVEEWS